MVVVKLLIVPFVAASVPVETFKRAVTLFAVISPVKLNVPAVASAKYKLVIDELVAINAPVVTLPVTVILFEVRLVVRLRVLPLAFVKMTLVIVELVAFKLDMEALTAVKAPVVIFSDTLIELALILVTTTLEILELIEDRDAVLIFVVASNVPAVKLPDKLTVDPVAFVNCKVLVVKLVVFKFEVEMLEVANKFEEVIFETFILEELIDVATIFVIVLVVADNVVVDMSFTFSAPVVILEDKTNETPDALVKVKLDKVPVAVDNDDAEIPVVASRDAVVNPVDKCAVEALILVKMLLAAFNTPVEILVEAKMVAVVIPVLIFKLDPDAFVNTVLPIVDVVADKVPVDILVVAKIVPVVIPVDALSVPLTSNV